MPYSGASDSSLPANVKKMSLAQRKQWVSIFNSAMSKSDDESKAFAMANGVLKKTKAFLPDVDSLSEVDRRQVSQQAAQYDPFGAADGKGCATCQWFISPNSCILVQGDISPNGISKFYTAEVDVTESPLPIPVYIIDGADDGDADDEMSVGFAEKAALNAAAEKKLSDSDYAYIDSKGGKHLPINDAAHVRNALARFNQTHFESDSKKSAALAKIHAAAKKFNIDVSKKSLALDNGNVFKSTFDWLAERFGGKQSSMFASPFYVLKSDDQWRVFLVYSNVYKDKVSEAIAEAAHKEYTEWASAHGVYPKLQLWHAGPMSEWGQIDFLAYVNGFAVSSGLVDKGKESVAEALEAEAKKGNLKVSHGYYGLKDSSGTYVLYRDFEHSPLPANAAANSWTGIALDIFAKENKEMPFTDAKRQWLKQIAGLEDTAINTWEASLKQAEDALTNAGIARKETPVEGATEGTTTDPLQVVLAEFKGVGESIGNLVTLVTTTKEQQDAKITELGKQIAVVATQVKKSQDDIVAEAYASAAAKAGAASGRPYVASEQASAAVGTAAVKEAAATEGDWFASIVMPGFADAQTQAASTQQAPLPVAAGAGTGAAAGGS